MNSIHINFKKTNYIGISKLHDKLSRTNTLMDIADALRS